jgi:hypothetical protein
MTTKLFPTSLALLSLAACESFTPGSLITDTRVLGARVEVEGDPSRSTPRPGERVLVSLLVEGSTETPALSWALAACVPGGSAGAACAGEPLGSAQGMSERPELSLTVPSDSVLGSSTKLQLGGIVCVAGTPELTERGARCAGDGAVGTVVLFDLPLARASDGSDDNQQPDLAQTTFALDEVAWTATSADRSGCAGQGLPEVQADEKEHDITIELGPSVRELYLSPDRQVAYEELQLSHFSSAGELSRQFTFVEPEDDRERPRVSVKWTAPKASKLLGDAQTVRLILVVRDMRGGIAWTERALCVVR